MESSEVQKGNSMLAQLTIEKKRGNYRGDFDGNTLYVFDRDNKIVFSVDRDAPHGLEDILILASELVTEHENLRAHQERLVEADKLGELGVEGV